MRRDETSLELKGVCGSGAGCESGVGPYQAEMQKSVAEHGLHALLVVRQGYDPVFDELVKLDVGNLHEDEEQRAQNAAAGGCVCVCVWVCVC